jgi:hypothetical protein
MEKDRMLIKLQDKIAAKKHFLLTKYRDTYKAAKQNEFLEGVLHDYEDYRQFMIMQKQKQIESLEIIHNHILQIKQTADFSKNHAENANLEQKRILREIQIIKSELDGIINDSNINTQTK